MHRRVRHISPKNAGAVLALDARSVKNKSTGDTVTLWEDQSSYGNHAMGASGPTYHATLGGGQPVLNFTSSPTTYLTGQDTALPAGGITYLGAHKCDLNLGGATYGATFHYGSASTYARKIWLYGELLQGGDNAFGFTQDGGAGGNQQQTRKWIVNYMQNDGSVGNLPYRFVAADKNPTTLDQGIYDTVLYTATTKTGTYYIGRYSNLASPLVGSICAIYMFSGWLKTELCRRFQQALAFTFKIPINK